MVSYFSLFFVGVCSFDYLKCSLTSQNNVLLCFVFQLSFYFGDWDE